MVLAMPWRVNRGKLTWAGLSRAWLEPESSLSKGNANCVRQIVGKGKHSRQETSCAERECSGSALESKDVASLVSCPSAALGGVGRIEKKEQDSDDTTPLSERKTTLCLLYATRYVRKAQISKPKWSAAWSNDESLEAPHERLHDPFQWLIRSTNIYLNK